MIIAVLVVVALDRRLFVCHVCHPLDCVLPLGNIYDLINLSDSLKEPAGLAAQHAGHRQAGVEDPLPLQGLLLLPHQKS